MNRQQFLAELSQYLTFFSPEEKAQIISAYNEKFNSAGSENEAALLAELGTPMMTAIDLKRRVEAGEQIAIASESDLKETEPLAEYSVETEIEETLTAENSEAVPQEPSEEQAEDVSSSDPEAVAEAEPSEEVSEEPSEVPAEEPVVPAPEVPAAKSIVPTPEASTEKTIVSSAPPVEYVEWVKPSRKVSVPKLIGASLLSIVITAFFLALAALGVVVLVAMSYLLLAGLKNLVYITDALLLFGGGLVCAGLGLLLVWFAVWSAGSLISSLFRNALGYGSDKECAA